MSNIHDSMEDSLERAKKKYGGALRIIFGRTGFMVAAVIVQIFVLIAAFRWLGDKIGLVYGGLTLLSAGVVIYIINRRENPAYQIAWILIVLVVPVFGALLYIFILLQMGVKNMARRMNSMTKTTGPYLTQDEEVMKNLESKSGRETRLARYMNRFGHYPMYRNNGIQYFPLGDDMLSVYLDELRSAKKYIFMEYFIVSRGNVWSQVLDILAEKVQEGVEVRVMYDGMCCLTRLPYHYPAQLEELGIKAKMFSPIRPALSSYQNNRDHRKITVIDGVTAFTGGINLADEYFNQEEMYGHWKDVAVMVRGRAVNSFLMMFLQTWDISEKEDEDVSRYWNADQQKLLAHPENINTGIQSEHLHYGGFAMPFGDSPLDDESVAKSVYMDIINEAHDFVYIMSPYLVLDSDLMTSLTFASKRGVKVMLLLPHIPDKKYAYLLARSYYLELIQSGIDIYEYTPGFVHAKVFLCDDIRAVVGSINLDYRSLYLHFECGCYIYDNEVIADIHKDFDNTLLKCQKITEEDCKKYPAVKRLAGQVLRIFAPLM